MPTSKPSPGHDIIVIGTSAGGVEALSVLAGDLPSNLPAAVFVVIHRSPDKLSQIHEILSRKGPLPAVEATDRQRIERGKIYFSYPDLQLLLESERIRCVKGPKESRGRSAIDPLFCSAASVYGPRVVGVILTGNLQDGSVGLREIKKQGGIAVVQDPEDAAFPEMPSSALKAVKADYCVALAKIPSLLAGLASL